MKAGESISLVDSVLLPWTLRLFKGRFREVAQPHQGADQDGELGPGETGVFYGSPKVIARGMLFPAACSPACSRRRHLADFEQDKLPVSRILHWVAGQTRLLCARNRTRSLLAGLPVIVRCASFRKARFAEGAEEGCVGLSACLRVACDVRLALPVAARRIFRAQELTRDASQTGRVRGIVRSDCR